MTIKQLGGVFGRNPTFNDVTIEGQLTFDGDIDINSDLKIEGDLVVDTDTLFVDASTDRVGINVAAPDADLEVSGIVNIDGIRHTKAVRKYLTASTANDIVSIAFGAAQYSCYTKLKYRAFKNNLGSPSGCAGEILIHWRSDAAGVNMSNDNLGSAFLTFSTTQDTGNNKITIGVDPGPASIFAEISYSLEVMPMVVDNTPTITFL